VSNGWDQDEELLAALREALHGRPGPPAHDPQAGQAVPPEFVEAGQALYTWRSIDAGSAHLTIELEASAEAILGQLVPVQTGLVEIQSGSGKGAETSVDTMGLFTIQPIPGRPFRLRCQAADGVVVLTEWLRL
jgi:hypothetical protein